MEKNAKTERKNIQIYDSTTSTSTRNIQQLVQMNMNSPEKKNEIAKEKNKYVYIM